MKHSIPFLAILGAVALLDPSPAARAQAWTTVYNSAGKGVSGVSGDIGTDAFGNVFAAGRHIATDGSSVAIVQAASANPGTAWELLDAYAEEGISYSHHRAFAANPNVPGHLFAGGNLNNVVGFNADGSPIYEFDALWIIRERNPATGVWETAEDYLDVTATFGEASVSDIRVAGDGAVYAAGGGAYTGWVVRKRTPGGSTFANVDVVAASTPGTGAWGMTVDPARGVIVAGQAGGLWTVRQSLTGNAGSWKTVDSVVPVRRGEWGGGIAKGAAVSSSGTICVAGTLWNNTTGKNHWVVRSSVDGGVTWSFTDNVIPAGADAEALGIAAGAAGELYVCGRVQQADGYHWIVRQGTPTTKRVKQGKTWVEVPTLAWSTLDDFQVVPGKNARANGIAVDADGNVFASGNGQDASGVSRFIVRKLERF